MSIATILPNSRFSKGHRWGRISTVMVPGLRRLPESRPLRVPNIRRDIRVQIASTRDECAQAFQLVADNYQARGYEEAGADYHFTSHHALPDTATFVAKEDERVVATMSLVADNTLLGLPMEGLYPGEIKELRQQGRHLGEVTSLAAAGLGLREFTPVFHTVIRLMKQYHLFHGGDTWVISVNPRHSGYYTRLLGYVPLGPRRAYPKVQGHPAEAYYLDRTLMQASAPEMYRRMFEKPLPAELLAATPLPADLVRHFGSHSHHTDPRMVEQILWHATEGGSLRRW